LLIDLKLDGKTIVVVGGGSEAYRKTQSFMDAGATIWVISRDFSSGIQELANAKKVSLIKTEIKDAKAFIGSLNPKPNVFLAVTNDSQLNLELVKAAKSALCMVYAVDNQALSDFTLPAVAHIGDVKVAVSTSGKSPAMARALRERIEQMITPEDLLEIDLQNHIRIALKQQVPDSKLRSRLLSEILNNDKIKQTLKEGKLLEAQELAIKLIDKMETKN
jgi:precorrin-2 dehydrogenase / sirohydrochlorin ferrochelatase